MQQLENQVWNDSQTEEHPQHRPHVLGVVLHLHVDKPHSLQFFLQVALLHQIKRHSAQRDNRNNIVRQRPCVLGISQVDSLVLLLHQPPARLQNPVKTPKHSLQICGMDKRLHRVDAIKGLVGEEFEIVVVCLAHRDLALRQAGLFDVPAGLDEMVVDYVDPDDVQAATGHEERYVGYAAACVEYGGALGQVQPLV